MGSLSLPLPHPHCTTLHYTPQIPSTTDTPSFLFLNKFHQMKSSRKDTMTISACCDTARDHKSRSRAITFCGMDPSHFRAFLENEKAVSTKDIDKYGDMASVVGLGPL